MNRRVLLLVAAVVAGSLAMGASGFSSASLERGVQVSVADAPEDALVPLADPGARGTHPAPSWVRDESLQREDPVTAQDRTAPLFLVHNRFDQPMSVTATVVESEVAGVSTIDSITVSPGDTRVVTGTVDCGEAEGPRTVTLEVTASTDETVATIEYQVTVVCASQQTPTETSTPASGSS